jgi:hypothetical protein
MFYVKLLLLQIELLFQMAMRPFNTFPVLKANESHEEDDASMLKFNETGKHGLKRSDFLCRNAAILLLFLPLF